MTAKRSTRPPDIRRPRFDLPPPLRPWWLALTALALAMVLAISVLGCATLRATPQFTDNAVRLLPPVEYAAWWGEMEECSGVDGDFNRVRWWVVPSDPIIYGDEQRAAAVTVFPRDVYIAAPNIRSRAVITHEILHVKDGLYDHRVPPFERCAPIYAPGERPIRGDG